MSERMECEEASNDDVTLVKYSNPVLVVKNPEKSVSSNNAKVYLYLSFSIQLMVVDCSSFKKQNPNKERDGKMSEGTDIRKETEEILNEILPPRSWEEDGQLWVQMVNDYHLTQNNNLIIFFFEGIECTCNSSRCH